MPVFMKSRPTWILERVLSSKNIQETTVLSTATSYTTTETSTISQTPYYKTPRKELSLAEKSRLSIMKKSQKKEGSKNLDTKKPPVLMQVTANNMNTLVILEQQRAMIPGEEGIPRSREVSDDNPETLSRVKKLMRFKLVKNAKNINELIDNWDEMVCDYIDVSLLANYGCIQVFSVWMLMVTLLLLHYV